MADQVEPIVTGELASPVDPRVIAMAQAIAAAYPQAARAVLFYGSCLRSAQLDGQMLDFYLIVSSYEAAYGKSWLARANKRLPPNVFPFEHDGLMAKIAVLSEADFARLCSPEARDVSVWARFAQPVRLVWQADEKAASLVLGAVCDAPRTLMAATLAIAPDLSDPLAIFAKGFTLTYGAELRAERSDRPASVVEHEPERYYRLGAAILAGGIKPFTRNGKPLSAEALWRGFRRRGKMLTIARLAKASFTYAGGIDYLAWKINRHAGTQIAIKPWQRKWPLVAAIFLVPKLLRSGAIR